MSEHTYKLTYFDGRGRAETSRLVFAAAGQKYEDVRIAWDKWPEFKPSTPFGAVPILEVDGSTVLCQSNAIAQYLANEFNLAGETPLDKARAHMIIECCEDIIKAEEPYWLEKDAAKKAEIKKTFSEEKLPKFLASLEKILEQNNGGDGFFVGSSVTWADLGFVSLSGWLEIVEADGQIANYEKLNALLKRVCSLPNVAEWLSKRPKAEW